MIDFRRAHPWIIIFLPLVGVLVAWFYHRYGNEVDGGSNLILDEIHNPKRHILKRMVAMIFGSGILSHLFGASVGREGVAVQVGAGISDQFSRHFGDYFNNRKIILMVGMSAGFSSIFGAPLAGAIFGIEILFLGMMSYEALFPCFLSSLVAYFTAKSLGIPYAHYAPIEVLTPTISRILMAAVAGILFGLMARFFIWALHFVQESLAKKCPNKIFRPFWGGILIVFSFYICQSDRYLNLGEEIIAASFIQQVLPWDFILKTLTTVVSVGFGFRGGEVMPLFYIGATMGNALSFILPLSVSMLSALGFVSVFAGAANIPIASLFLAIEFFGAEIGVYAAVAIVMSYLFSGQKGLYRSQRKHLLQKL